MSNAYDLIVIGGGPGGYVAAIRAAQLGFSVACVEKRKALGGTCLNEGCIPSKALLHSSHLYETAKKDFARHGIKASNLEADVAAMMKRKDQVVEELAKGIEYLFKKNKISFVTGQGAITGKNEVTVSEGNKKAAFKARNVLIATGSYPAPLPGVAVDEERIISPAKALALDHAPPSLAVIGAGAIGLELGSVWRRLGSQVTVIEFQDQILPGMDAETANHLHRILKKQGMNFMLSSKVAKAKASKSGVAIGVQPVSGGGVNDIEADVMLVAVGRRPYTEGLLLENAGVELDERGFVKVDKAYQTSVPGIFAIGDVTGGMMLAHKAEEEGIAAAENMAGQAGHVNYAAIPGVVYTWPEAASVGQTEEALKKNGQAYKAGKFPFGANSRARAIGDADGFVKVLADARTDAVLGVHIVGPAAGGIIQEAVAVMEFGGAAEDIARTCHAHPGLSEALKEAALAACGRAIHV